MKQALALTLALALGTAAAADEVVLESGERIRARLANGGVITGTLLRASDTSLQIATSSRIERELQLDAVVGVERSLGPRRQTLPGAAWGAAVGGVFALMFLSGDGSAGDVGQIALRSIPMCGVIGAAIGSVVQREVWRPVDLAGVRSGKLRLGLALQPTHEGLSSGVSVSWR